MSNGYDLNQHKNLLAICKSLANENRQFIVFEIFGDKQEHTVSEVASRADIAISTASAHLTHLKRAGVLTSRKQNKEVIYLISEARIAAFVKTLNDWLGCC